MDRAHWADGRDLLTYVVGPALGLWGLILGMGLAIRGPLAGPLRAEYGVSKRLAADRNGTWNTITLVLSYMGGTEIVIGFSLIVAALVLWRTRDWSLAAVPAIAILLETAIFLSISSLVGRGRPQVDKLDVAPPTSSYPSGHVGASTALYLAFALSASSARGCGGPRLLPASPSRSWWPSPACTAACITSPTSLQALSRALSVRYSRTAGIAIELTMPRLQSKFSSALRPTRTDLESGPVSRS
jgi:membrane-associated phospholipid phosphatase